MLLEPTTALSEVRLKLYCSKVTIFASRSFDKCSQNKAAIDLEVNPFQRFVNPRSPFYCLQDIGLES